jgi:hypothetical protein
MVANIQQSSSQTCYYPKKKDCSQNGKRFLSLLHNERNQENKETPEAERKKAQNGTHSRSFAIDIHDP